VNLKQIVREMVDEDGVKGFVGKQWVWSAVDELRRRGFRASPDDVIEVLGELGVDVAWEWE
jgi:hypothetical protein